MSHNSFIEGLESRTFLSATPIPVLFDRAVLHDRIVVKADLLKFELDSLRFESKLGADIHKVKKETPAGDTSLTAPLAQLATDNTTLQTTLKTDRLADAATVMTDEATNKADIAQIKKDKGNSSAETMDHAKLATDRSTLQTDLLANLDTRIMVRQAAETTISNDTAAIVSANMMDTASTGGLTKAVDKFSADRNLAIDKLTFDLQAVSDARQQLANDLAAEAS